MINALFALFIGCFGMANAQTANLVVPCGNLAVEICPVYDPSWGSPTGVPNPLPGNCNTCSLSPVSCRSYQYAVSLVTQGNISQDFSLDYEAILATLTLTATGPNPVPLSRINVAATKACLPFAFTNFIGVTENVVDFDFHAPPNEQLPNLIFTATPPMANYRCRLFNVIVDAWPGETVTLACSNPPSPATTYVDGNGNSCTDNLNGLGGNFSCFNPLGSGGTVVVPQPAPSNQLVCIEWAADPANRILYGPANQFLPTIPVFLNSNVLQASQIDELDFMVKIVSTNPIQKPTITVESGFVANVTFSDPIKVPNTNNWLVPVLIKDKTIKPDDFNQFLHIDINPPMNTSLPGMVYINLIPGRLTGTMNNTPTCEMSCVDDDILEVCYPGYDPCTTDDFRFKVEAIGSMPDCRPRVLLSLNWTHPDGFEAKLRHIKLDLDFKLSGNLTTGSVNNNGALTLPNCLGCNNPTFPQPGCGINNLNWNGCGNKVPVFEFANGNLLICFDGPAGAGSEHAVWNNELFMELVFDGVSGSIDDIVVHQAEIGLYDGANLSICSAPVDIVGLPAVSSTNMFGRVVNHYDQGLVQDVEMRVTTPIPSMLPIATILTGNSGTNNFHYCAEAHAPPSPYEFLVTPHKDINPLNGVSTFDLVRMSKHILNVQPFTTPYQYIAGDINHNQQVTTFDIVELRKLILGIYTDFPANESWRFVEKNYVFQNLPPTQNPLDDNFDEEKTIYLNSADREASFTAVKIGDLTGDAINNNVSGQMPVFEIKATPETPEKGIIFFPIKAAGKEPLIALQAGLKFDPEKLELIGVSQATIKGLTNDCFGYNDLAKGLVKLIWLSPDYEDEALMPGQVLCYLTFKQKGKKEAAPALLLSNDTKFEGLGFSATDKVYSLKMAQNSLAEKADDRENAETGVPKPVFKVQPNPTDGETLIRVELPAEEKIGRLSVYGPFGVRMFYREFKAAKGRFDVPIAESAKWPTGVYTWQWLGSTSGKHEGRIIKI